MSQGYASSRRRKANLRTAASGAIYEFVLLTLPVGLYVALESYIKNDLSYFVTSPEWAIATIFLSVQAVTIYFNYLSRTGLKTNHHALGGFVFLALVIVVTSSINAIESLRSYGTGSTGALTLRLALFWFASMKFLLLVASARYVYRISKK